MPETFVRGGGGLTGNYSHGGGADLEKGGWVRGFLSSERARNSVFLHGSCKCERQTMTTRFEVVSITENTKSKYWLLPHLHLLHITHCHSPHTGSRAPGPPRNLSAKPQAQLWLCPALWKSYKQVMAEKSPEKHTE